MTISSTGFFSTNPFFGVSDTVWVVPLYTADFSFSTFAFFAVNDPCFPATSSSYSPMLVASDPFRPPLNPSTTSFTFPFFLTISTLPSVTGEVEVGGGADWPALRIVSVDDDGLPSDAPLPPGLLNTTFTVNGDASDPAFFTGIMIVCDAWPAANVSSWFTDV